MIERNKLLLTILLAVVYPVHSKFVDKIKESGIEFVQYNGMEGQMLMPEIFGSGVAFIDYDNDGDMDIYLVQSGKLSGNDKKDLKYLDRLYRNDTTTRDNPKFTDVTSEAGIVSEGYGMGVASGDFNNDGFDDLFVANFGSNKILMNNGNGTFSSPENSIDLGSKKWSIAASVMDQNADGFLDIYVVNYVNYSLTHFIKQCKAYDGTPDYCSPQSYTYESDDLYKNKGNGTFENIGYKAGMSQFESPGLGVVAADLNGDNKIDYYVANDGVENHFWANKGNDEFMEIALASGIAVNMNGEPEASMGVDAADFDHDGDVDLFMTHLARQTNTLYVNNGKGWFTDLTVMKKLGSTSYSSTGFGTIWFDYDNDGLLDLFSANGAVSKIVDQIKAKDPYPYKQANQIWKNIGNGRYVETSQQQGENFLDLKVSRGAALGDFDNDGDWDIFVSGNNGTPQFLVNELKNNNSWIGIKAIRKDLNRVDLGAVISIKEGKHVFSRRVKTDGSYASSHDNRVLIGLGDTKGKVDVTVSWTNGKSQIFKSLEINKYHELVSNEK